MGRYQCRVNGKWSAFIQRCSDQCPLKALYDIAQHSPIYAHIHTHTAGGVNHAGRQPTRRGTLRGFRCLAMGHLDHLEEPGGIQLATFRLPDNPPLYLLSNMPTQPSSHKAAFLPPFAFFSFRLAFVQHCPRVIICSSEGFVFSLEGIKPTRSDCC